MGSDPLSETDLAGSVQNTYVFFNGQRVARSDSAGVHYYFSDQVGSHGVVENATATVCEQDIDYYPYGAVQNDYCALVPQHHKFTGKERDAESGLDNFGARYNASSMGRFVSVDPLWVKADRMVDPQRLNLYAYGRNNPLKFTDPTGMDMKMGNCPGNMTISMCEHAITNGLRKEDRGHVHFIEGNGKNGLGKGDVLIQADKDYKSSSPNFTRLQGLTNDHSGVGVMNVEAPTGAFPMVTVTGWSSKTGTAYANGSSTLGHLTDADAFHGSTLFPLVGSAWSPLSRYTPLPWTEVYVNSEDASVELAVDVAHELVHVKLGDFGRNPGAAAHQSPDHPNPELEKQIGEAEDEARKNAQQKD
ncbi:MAG TPA: RHS repeat-associated core domain-containing protein [Candidatus Acidoferrum sp.]|nr:RHS repeat-associated core domain-containing protein [Candidatus Acidoferrum sp.]